MSTSEEIKKTITKKSLLISLIIVSIATFVIFLNFGFTDKNTAKDANDIQKLIKKSIEITNNLPQYPEPYSSNNDEIPENIKKMMHEKVPTALMDIYSAKSPLLSTRIQNVQKALELQDKEKFRSKGAGIKKIDNLIINIGSNNEDIATAEADITVWAKILGPDKKINNPENTAHYTFSLLRDDGVWKITGESFDFLPGQSP